MVGDGDLADEALSPSVDVVRTDDVVPDLQLVQDGHTGGQPGGVDLAMLAILQRGQVLLENISGRVASSGIIVPLGFSRSVLLVGGAERDRRDDL